jgi:thiol-disulfide isomerase/thioredoxin
MTTGRRRRRLGGAAALLAACLTAAGCASTGAPVNVGLGYLPGNGAADLVSTADRAPVTPFTGPLLGGGHFSMREWRGHVVVVDFWQSDCAPCQAEAPVLESAYRTLHAVGVDFVGVDVRDDPAAALAFVRSNSVSYPSVVDPTGALSLDFPLPPAATPTTVVVDARGREAAIVTGPVTYRLLVGLVRRVRTGSAA